MTIAPALIFGLVCGMQGTAPAAPTAGWLSRYDLQHPARVIALPPALVEVSGVAAWDSNTVVLHNDEDGVLYLVRTTDGRIVRQVQLGPRIRHGDFEDLTLLGHHGYLAKSNGTLLEFTLDDTSSSVPCRKYTGGLGGFCEVESLAPALTGSGLVVACKHVKGIRRPGALTLLRWAPRTLYDLHPVIRVPGSAFGGAGEAHRFAASGMTRTPDASGWIVLDGPHARIVELSGDGRVIALEPLRRDLLPQAEGVAFGVDGSLYLTSEGRGGPGVLAVYLPATR